MLQDQPSFQICMYIRAYHYIYGYIYSPYDMSNGGPGTLFVFTALYMTIAGK